MRTQRFETVYNFTVSNHHTYFVGENAAWVHNIHICDPIDKFRRTPNNLAEKLVMDEAKGGAGEIIMKPLSDPRYKGMRKIQHKHLNPDGTKTIVHYVLDPKTGAKMDFKFK